MLFTFVACLFSAFALATAQADQCSQLQGYAPALLHCAIKYPVPIPTVTSTRTTTVTVKATTTPKTTTTTVFNFSTTRSATTSEVRTITAVVEVTVTNCDNISRPTCTKQPTSSKAKRSLSLDMNEEMKRSEGLEARDVGTQLQPRTLGLLAQVFAWAKVLASGENAVQSVCACIQPPPSKTVTVYTTATVTARV